jgi:hypothetical protein
MQKSNWICLLMGTLLLALAAPANADIGLTDNCQDDIDKLRDDIKDDKDDYTAESRRKAEAQLAAARANRLDPLKCRKNIQDARQELREGKRDKKDKDD